MVEESQTHRPANHRDTFDAVPPWKAEDVTSAEPPAHRPLPHSTRELSRLVALGSVYSFEG